MTVLLLVIGAVFGAVALGFPGLFLGAGLGYGLALLIEVRQRIDQLERTMETRQKRRRSVPPAEPGVQTIQPAVAEPAEPIPPGRNFAPAVSERYPEEEMVAALRDSEEDRENAGAELADFYREVDPGRSPSRPSEDHATRKRPA